MIEFLHSSFHEQFYELELKQIELNKTYLIKRRLLSEIHDYLKMIKSGHVKVYKKYIRHDWHANDFLDLYLNDILIIYVECDIPDFKNFEILVSGYLINTDYFKYGYLLEIVYDYLKECKIEDLERILENGELK